MAGHSKFANIKHRKKAQDVKRGKIFTKLRRIIEVAAKQGGPDLDANPALRDAVDKALKANMTRDTIDKAIQRSTGTQDSADMEVVLYEGYGPNGVAVLVDCLTDNRNRTVAEVRHAFSKAGGNLGTSGSVAYLFNPCGVLQYDSGVDEEVLMDVALEAGAEDVQVDDAGVLEVLVPASAYHAIKTQLTDAGFPPTEAELTQRPTTQVSLDQDGAEKMIRLLDLLEDLDDVQQVYSNLDVPDDVLSALG